MQDFRNLDVWQRARTFTKTIYAMTTDFPDSDQFGLNSRMRRASVSICTNIAEGCGRRGDAGEHFGRLNRSEADVERAHQSAFLSVAATRPAGSSNPQSDPPTRRPRIAGSGSDS